MNLALHIGYFLQIFKFSSLIQLLMKSVCTIMLFNSVPYLGWIQKQNLLAIEKIIRLLQLHMASVTQDYFRPSVAFEQFLKGLTAPIMRFYKEIGLCLYICCKCLFSLWMLYFLFCAFSWILPL